MSETGASTSGYVDGMSLNDLPIIPVVAKTLRVVRCPTPELAYENCVFVSHGTWQYLSQVGSTRRMHENPRIYVRLPNLGHIYTCKEHVDVPEDAIALTTYQRKDCHRALELKIRVEPVEADAPGLAQLVANVEVLTRTQAALSLRKLDTDVLKQLVLARFDGQYFARGQTWVTDVPNVGGVSLTVIDTTMGDGAQYGAFNRGILTPQTNVQFIIGCGFKGAMEEDTAEPLSPRSKALADFEQAAQENIARAKAEQEATQQPKTQTPPTPPSTPDLVLASINMVWPLFTAPAARVEAELPAIVAELLRMWMPHLKQLWMLCGGADGIMRVGIPMLLEWIGKSPQGQPQQPPVNVVMEDIRNHRPRERREQHEPFFPSMFGGLPASPPQAEPPNLQTWVEQQNIAEDSKALRGVAAGHLIGRHGRGEGVIHVRPDGSLYLGPGVTLGKLLDFLFPYQRGRTDTAPEITVVPPPYFTL